MNQIKNEKIEIAVLKTQMQEVNKSVGKLETSINAQFKNLNDKIDDLPERYAAKWVEKFVWVSISTVGTVIIVAVLRLIIIQ